MTKKFLLITTLALLLVMTWGGESIAETPDRIIVALNEKPSFPNRGRPGTEHSKNPGVAFETLKLIEARLNIPFVFERYPYKRCLAYLQYGLVDAVMTASFDDKRTKQGVYPLKNGRPDAARRVYNSSYYLYVTKRSKVRIVGNKLMNLKGPIGAELGFSIVGDLAKQGIRVHSFPTPDACFLPLSQNRIAGVAAHETTGQRFIRKYPNIRQLDPPLISKPYFLILSHQFYNANPDLSDKIWDMVEELRQSTDDWKILKDKYYSLKTWPEGE